MNEDELMKEAMIVASGQYLSEHLPSDWFDLDENDFYEFVENHTWEPLEYGLSTKDVIDCISQTADNIVNFHLSHME
jgi:hypothetical protein